MINIQPIENPEIYTIGTWTSPLLTNANCLFPSDISTEWGYLSWTESNTGTGFNGYIRIDILDSANNVLIADIAKNSDGSVTSLFSTIVATSNIKIKVKLYGLDYPTPEVSNLWLNYKNWNTANVVTNNGKNVMLNRSFLSAPTTNYISQMRYGNGQVTNFVETSTAQTNEIGDWATADTFTFDPIKNTVQMAYEITNGEGVITNGTIMNSIGFRNQDASPIFCAAARMSDITKNPAYYYRVTATFKVIATPTSRYILTSSGRNIFIDRTFNNVPTYSPPTKFVLGYTGTLSDSMTNLDTEIVGPSSFTYTLFDTSNNKILVRGGMDSSTGNGSTFNAICNKNTDATPILNYAAKTYTDILKSSTYIYQFDTSYRSITPISTIG